jgi:hypothetical protein
MEKLSEATPACNTQEKNEMGIVLGAQRLRRATWWDAAAMCRNGAGYVRDGDDIRHFTSEAYENGLWKSASGKLGH